MKSTLLKLGRENPSYLELPFVTAAYDHYFSLLKEETDPFPRWRDWVCS